ncbi:polymer-forming cytoskeletal protein [Clostridiaceae bacterium 35-E11]
MKMFKKSDMTVNEKFDTLIGKNSKFEGKLDAEGTVRIDGEFHGNIKVIGDLIVGEEGKMLGDVSASNIIISGIVEGNIIASNQLTITNTATVLGDIHITSLIVEEKAIFQGQCTMKKEVIDDNVSTLNSKIAQA